MFVFFLFLPFVIVAVVMSKDYTHFPCGITHLLDSDGKNLFLALPNIHPQCLRLSCVAFGKMAVCLTCWTSTGEIYMPEFL